MKALKVRVVRARFDDVEYDPGDLLLVNKNTPDPLSPSAHSSMEVYDVLAPKHAEGDPVPVVDVEVLGVATDEEIRNAEDLFG